MKAMVLEDNSRLEAREVARPAAAPGEALIRVTHSGICGTDLKIYQGGIAVRHPLIMGHEMVGEIVTGEGCDGAGPGARVIVDPVLFCGACYHCRAGQTHICPTGALMGRDRDGGFAEYVTAPSANLFPLPHDVGAAEAPLIQVLTTCVHGHRLTPMMAGMTQEVQDSLAAQVPFPRRLGRPDEYAKTVQFIYETTYVNSETIRCDGAIRMQAK